MCARTALQIILLNATVACVYVPGMSACRWCPQDTRCHLPLQTLAASDTCIMPLGRLYPADELTGRVIQRP